MSLQLEPDRFFPSCSHPIPAREGFDDVTPGRRVALFLPIAPLTLPRTTRRGWWARSKRYMAWRDAVRFEAFCHIRRRCKEQGLDVWPPGTPLVSDPFRLWVAIAPGALRSNADLSNLLKALEDVLVGWAIPDDSVRYLKDTRGLEIAGMSRDGFAFLLEHLAEGALFSC